MYEVKTQIDIEASAERVFSILADFERYPEWNPFITEADGDARLGARLRIRIEPLGGRPMTFTPTVTVFEPNQELRWFGRLVLPRLFDGEHIFFLDARGPELTRFLHAEQFNGVLVSIFSKDLSTTVYEGFEAMNRALKERAESG